MMQVSALTFHDADSRDEEVVRLWAGLGRPTIETGGASYWFTRKIGKCIEITVFFGWGWCTDAKVENAEDLESRLRLAADDIDDEKFDVLEFFK